MTDQLWFAVTLVGAFVTGALSMWVAMRYFGGRLAFDKLVDFVNVMIVAMDEGQPGLSGLQKKERVIAIAKAYLPGVSPELVSFVIDGAYALWRLETEGVSPKDNNSPGR